MQLPDQLLKQLRILTDKPISPKVNKQLYALLLHDNLPLQKTIQLLCLKYRADLIIHLLQNNRWPAESVMNTVLNSILSNILEYKINEILQLYILILTKLEEDKKLLEIGYYQLIKLAIKQPNLETKQKLLEIILSNGEYLYKRKCKKVIMAIVSNYLDVFNKFLIYVPSYVSIVQFILEIDTNSKKIINKNHPQRQPELEEIFIDLSSQQLNAIKNIILSILQNTKDKQNYALHKNCLGALKSIGKILNEFKVKQSELQFTQLDVGQICRTIQIFIDKKGTIDEARFAKAEWMRRFEQLKKIKDLKTEKYINPSNAPSLLLDPKENQKPLLIQQVISKTNNYRLKYQVSPEENELQPSKIISVSNNFLKKGGGVGGGRTYLLNEKQKTVSAQQKMKNKNLYDGIIDRCFEQCNQELEYKSFVDPKVLNEEQQTIKIQPEPLITQKVPEPKQQRLTFDQIHINWQNVPAFSTKQSQNNNEKYNNYESMKESVVTSSMIEDDEQVQQISNLIDLAYSFKFS